MSGLPQPYLLIYAADLGLVCEIIELHLIYTCFLELLAAEYVEIYI